MAKAQRLDEALVARGLCENRSKARALILAGDILVNGQRQTKAGSSVSPEAALEIVQRNPYVSRGGLKLKAALDHFGLERLGFGARNLFIALDVGASTGGFTDCLLQAGATKVYAVDVGYGQLDSKLRKDPRVVVMERTNIRSIDRSAIPEEIHLIVIDVSFISILKFLPSLRSYLAPGGFVLAMVKPQFEGERGEIGKGGIVRAEETRQAIFQRFERGAGESGFKVEGAFDSPVHGAKGNRERFMLLVPGSS